jgi:hypothetical protein
VSLQAPMPGFLMPHRGPFSTPRPRDPVCEWLRHRLTSSREKRITTGTFGTGASPYGTKLSDSYRDMGFPKLPMSWQGMQLMDYYLGLDYHSLMLTMENQYYRESSSKTPTSHGRASSGNYRSLKPSATWHRHLSLSIPTAASHLLERMQTLSDPWSTINIDRMTTGR